MLHKFFGCHNCATISKFNSLRRGASSVWKNRSSPSASFSVPKQSTLRFAASRTWPSVAAAAISLSFPSSICTASSQSTQADKSAVKDISDADDDDGDNLYIHEFAHVFMEDRWDHLKVAAATILSNAFLFSTYSISHYFYDKSSTISRLHDFVDKHFEIPPEFWRRSRWYTLITYTFMHLNLSHLRRNSVIFLCFFVVSPEIPIWKLITVYFSGGAISGAIASLAANCRKKDISVVGSSGAVHSLISLVALNPSGWTDPLVALSGILVLHAAIASWGLRNSLIRWNPAMVGTNVAHLVGLLWGIGSFFVIKRLEPVSTDQNNKPPEQHCD